MTSPARLCDRRQRIGAIDERLADLLLERLALASSIVEERVSGGGAARDLEQEASVLTRLSEHAHDDEQLRHLAVVYEVLLAGGTAPAVRGATPPAVQHSGACISVGAARFRPGGFELIAGPCAVENEAQLMAAARAARAAGARVLRGGAFKPRTSPESFQGLGEQGLVMLRDAADACEMAMVTEVMEPGLVPKVAEFADILQVGSRNMHSAPLLREVGRTGLPVLLKRGMSASLDELLYALDYVRGAGGEQVVLCLRGLRTASGCSRFTLDLAAIRALKERVDVPVIVDPSHAAGRRELVAPLALAGVAAGADGLMIEVHPEPALALCDGPQALRADELITLMHDVRALLSERAHSRGSMEARRTTRIDRLTAGRDDRQETRD